MALGRLQLKKISPDAEKPETVQINVEEYEGDQFVGSVQEDHLAKFLRETLRMDADFVERLLDELYLHGEAIVPRVSLPISDLGASGLQHLPNSHD